MISNKKVVEAAKTIVDVLQAAGRVPKLHLPLVWVRSLELCDRCL